MNKIPMTASGYSQLKEELQSRVQVERPRIIKSIAEARAHGDLSENAEYHAAKEMQSLNETRIIDLEQTIARAEIIDVSKLSGQTITFGATVKLIDEDTEQVRRLQLVGEVEGEPSSGKLSITSPIAKALLGKSVGDVVEVITPGGPRSYEILEVCFN